MFQFLASAVFGRELPLKMKNIKREGLQLLVLLTSHVLSHRLLPRSRSRSIRAPALQMCCQSSSMTMQIDGREAHEKHPKCNCHWNIMKYQSVLVHISNPAQNCNSFITLHTISYHDLLRAECVWSFNPLTIYSLASIAPNLETWFAILLQVLHGSNFQFACYWLRFARLRNP